MPPTLKQLGELGLIERIRRTVPKRKDVIVGIGDDAAVLDAGAKDWLLFTTDMLAEGTHFTRKDKPQGVGHKAMACSISDIAAMGGIPTFAVVSLGAPSETRCGYILGIQAGIMRTAKRFGVAVVGGDTIRSRKLVINVAMLGRVKKSQLVTRGGARPGDKIFVTGPLGRSWKSGKHLTFIPRLKESRLLAGRFRPRAMIDISDGLIADLGHILRQSRAGARIDLPRVPLNPRCSVRDALYDGEDFELLFTLPASRAGGIKKLKPSDGSFYEIGTITAQAARPVLLDHAGKEVTFDDEGFKHF